MSKKFLKTVTITGVDDRVDPSDLFAISQEFPFVEWGILLNGKGGKSRYPSAEWITKTENCWNEALVASQRLPQFAGHISGQLVRDIVETAEYAPEVDMFERIQFNMKSCTVFNEAFLHRLSYDDWTQFIFQVDDFKNDFYKVAKSVVSNCCPLFDRSGGRGVLPEAWEQAQEFSGFAGGLTPENLLEQIELISEATDHSAWIDVESGVRTNDSFDLQKVRRFLEIAAPYVM